MPASKEPRSQEDIIQKILSGRGFRESVGAEPVAAEIKLDFSLHSSDAGYVSIDVTFVDLVSGWQYQLCTGDSFETALTNTIAILPAFLEQQGFIRLDQE